jgi:hypothetical protein
MKSDICQHPRMCLHKWTSRDSHFTFCSKKILRSICFNDNFKSSPEYHLTLPETKYSRAREAVDNVYVNLFWWVIVVFGHSTAEKLKCGKVNCREREGAHYGVLIWITWLALVLGGRREGNEGKTFCLPFPSTTQQSRLREISNHINLSFGNLC